MIHTHKILVVNNDTAKNSPSLMKLRKFGYYIIQAFNIEQALCLMRNNNTDMAIVDDNILDNNSLDFVKAVRSGEAGGITKERPLLLLTDLNVKNSVDHALRLGCTDFITKPITFPILVERVKFALQSADREKVLQQWQFDQVCVCKLANLGFWQLDFINDSLAWSEGACDILNLDVLPESRQSLLALLNNDDGHSLDTALEIAEDGRDGLNLDVTLHLDNSMRVIRLQSNPKTYEKNLTGSFQDVTDQRAFENMALYRAEHDELTGLLNRRFFLNSLNKKIANSTSMVWSISVIDIKQFHRVNDALGNDAGDQVLVHFARRLNQNLDQGALVCRLEADIFAVAVPHSDSRRVENFYHEWMEPLARACMVKAKEVFVDFSAGVSLYPQDGTHSDELLRKALMAQRFCRDQTCNKKWSFYQAVEILDDTKALGLENDLHKALGNKEFFLVYQPQLMLSSNHIVGVEALLRWRHPKHGVMSPAEFVPLLEENGLIIEVGDWVAKEACWQLSEWQAEGIDIDVAINLSTRQFEQAGLVKHLLDCVTRYDIRPQNLSLEITESTAMHSPEATLVTLNELKKHGFKLAIDDFGTGHSSYEYLLRFPLDTLKIDRSFITDVVEERSNRAIVRSLTALSQGMGFNTVAEGVENQRQRDYLDALDVDIIQGFLLSKPIEPQDLVEFLRIRVRSFFTRSSKLQ